MWKRAIEKSVQRYLHSKKNKILFIWGPRRSGKTTILTKISKDQKVPIFNFDLLSDRELFQPKKDVLERLTKKTKLILIDEIQNYPESTLALKILSDVFKVKIIATGSSELRQKSNEFDSLAGRYEELFCLPFSAEEIVLNSKVEEYEKKAFTEKIADEFQTYGSYPEIYLSKSLEAEKINLLKTILEGYLLKDIINIYSLKNSKLAIDILTKIALQLGSEVSLREIANSLSANVSTVSSYIEIFIKNYVLISLPSFKTNLRRAVSENRKLYFYDLGIRNFLIRDFRPLDLRPDRGGVFENFIIAEMVKKRLIDNIPINFYFYREYGGKEVDIVIEDYKRRYMAVEIKNNKNGNVNVFPLPHRSEQINKENYYSKINKYIFWGK